MPRIWPQILAATLFAALLTWFDQARPHYVPGFTPTPFILIGLAISIFLGFRNSASYDRFWEGRKLRGQLIIDGRTLAQQWINLREALGGERSAEDDRAGGLRAAVARFLPFVMVVLGTTIHEFACRRRDLPIETRGWSDQARP